MVLPAPNTTQTEHLAETEGLGGNSGGSEAISRAAEQVWEERPQPEVAPEVGPAARVSRGLRCAPHLGRSLLLHPWDQLGFASNRCPLRRKNFTAAHWGPASSYSGGTGLVCPTVLCPTASQYGSPGREEEEKDGEKEVMTRRG